MGTVTALAALAGAAAAAGLVLLVVGLWPVEVGSEPRPSRRWPHGLSRRVLLGGAAAAAMGLLTRWPAVALLVGALGWAGPSLFRGAAGSRSAIARIEAVASWTEMLQGLLAAAAGLLLLNRAYLAPFARPAGQLVLLLVGACYAAAYWLLARMARMTGPERLVLADAPGRTDEEAAP